MNGTHTRKATIEAKSGVLLLGDPCYTLFEADTLTDSLSITSFADVVERIERRTKMEELPFFGNNAGMIFKVRPGTMFAEATTRGNRTFGLKVEAAVGTAHVTNMLAGTVFNDAGLMMFSDPKVTMGKLDPEVWGTEWSGGCAKSEDGNTFCDKLQAKDTPGEATFFELAGTLSTCTGWGDGEYEVWVAVDEDGFVQSVEISFDDRDDGEEDA